MWLCLFVFFFFKQKTAYEMRISDWSSDVCSSDLPQVEAARVQRSQAQVNLDRTTVRSPSAGRIAQSDRLQVGQMMVAGLPAVTRSEERRVGKECVSTCRSRWSPYP